MPIRRRPAARRSELPALRLKRGEDRRLRAGHLWVFSNEVDNEATPLTAVRARFDGAGAVAIAISSSAIAYVNPHALICARILSRSPVQPPDRSLLVHRLKVALALRERLYSAPYYRWVFGESDGLPGLVLDRYGDVIVGQIATAGMEALRAEIEAAVAERARAARAGVEERRRRARARAAAAAAADADRARARRTAGAGRRPELHRAAGRRAEDRLVLRSERQPRAVARG